MKHVVKTKFGVIREGYELTWAGEADSDEQVPDCEVIHVDPWQDAIIVKLLTDKIGEAGMTLTLPINLFGEDACIVSEFEDDSNPNAMFKTYKSQSEE